MYFYYFGYGSLVNAQTRRSGDAVQLVTLNGWVREWKQCIDTPSGRTCSLTITPKTGSSIDGVLAREDIENLAALDAREIGYFRSELIPRDFAKTSSSLPESAYVYQSLPAHYRPANPKYPILQSYVDCVIKGFLDCYGEEGVQRFMASTEGWEGTLLNDRDKPQYPRAVLLKQWELDYIDQLLAAVR